MIKARIIFKKKKLKKTERKSLSFLTKIVYLDKKYVEQMDSFSQEESIIPTVYLKNLSF